MDKGSLSARDPNSFATPDVMVTHTHIVLEVDFDQSLLSGHVDISVSKQKPTATDLVLDTLDLQISEVTDAKTGTALEWVLDSPVGPFGSKMTIKLPSAEIREVVNIKYKTSPKASALQWLTPEQTLGKKHPYVFSQCQPIHCRSMLPCQDTPSVKSTYSAEITAPSELVVLMSALREGSSASEKSGYTVHKFQQPVSIPSYLIAIVVGALESRKIGPRSHVWSEKECVEEAAHEFAETEKMLSTAEEICGPYVWKIYDLLVLPPSFPFGGMENPCLTFVTPTILAGDRSLADVIVHEISHSWTGNLVTNKNFEHFWLNEGFTMFVERKILARMFGDKTRHFSALNGLKDLKDTLLSRGMDDPTTCLVPDLRGIHPDDAFSTVPYEKGHTFLFYLETILGGPSKFDPFLKNYLEHFKYQSIDTDHFKDYLTNYFEASNGNALKEVDWKAWLHTPGMPPVIPEYDTTLSDVAIHLADKWTQWDGAGTPPFDPLDIKDMSSLQLVCFLAQLLLEKPLTLEKLQIMDKIYDMTSRKNSEICFRWLRLCIRGKWKEMVPRALTFVSVQGRMKFVRPIYRDLYAWEEVRQQAVSHFQNQRSKMMHVAAHTVAQDLKLEK